MRLPLAIALVGASIVACAASFDVNPSVPVGCRPLPHISSAIEWRPYDVLRYDLILDWRAPLRDSSHGARAYWGQQTITLRAHADLDSIEFDADRVLSIEAARIRRSQNGAWKQVTVSRPEPDMVAVLLDDLLRLGDTLQVQFDFRNLSESSNPNQLYGGYNRFWRDPTNDTLLPAPLAYTMSQPNSARRWMPCNDRPYDKAYATITILAPPGFTTLSNGIAHKTKVVLSGDTLSALQYESITPIATYLMVAIASRYAARETTYISPRTGQHIPLRLFLWHTDSLAYADDAEWMLSVTASMMQAFEHYLAPYPFSSYGQALLYPYFKGAMEHQTMTTLYRDALTQRWETVIAHELAHQWLGDLVTCATWNDLWLNEGGATFGERLWIEFAYGPDQARRYFAQRRDRDYLRRDGARSQPPVYNTSGTNLFNTGTTYVKAGWIYHMMRTMLGDSAFFYLMEQYFDAFAHRSLETEDLREFCERFARSSPVPWRTFFDQWVYGRGHPVFDAELIGLEPVANGYRAHVRILQRQDTAVFLPVYVVPLPLRFREYFSDQPLDTTVLITSRDQLVVVDLPFLPRSMELDPLETILCEKDTAALILSAPEQTIPGVTITPNPVESGQDIMIWLSEHASATLARLWSIDGRCVQTAHIAGSVARLQTSTLRPGVYAVEITDAGGPRGRTLIVVR
jgi:aminopeptidase N